MAEKGEMGRGEAVLGILTLCLGPLHLTLIIPNGVGVGYGGFLRGQLDGLQIFRQEMMVPG